MNAPLFAPVAVLTGKDMEPLDSQTWSPDARRALLAAWWSYEP